MFDSTDTDTEAQTDPCGRRAAASSTARLDADDIHRRFSAARYGLGADPRDPPEALIHAVMSTAEAYGLDVETSLKLVVVQQHEAIRDLRRLYVKMIDDNGVPLRSFGP